MSLGEMHERMEEADTFKHTQLLQMVYARKGPFHG